MKTQISSLINGSENTVRNLSAEKYSANPVGHFCNKTNTPQNGGTPTQERMAVAVSVGAENPEGMRIKANGVELNLIRVNSLSGKTWSWNGALTANQYEAILGKAAPVWEHKGAVNTYSIEINQDCTVFIHATSGKKGFYEILGEEFIEIL